MPVPLIQPAGASPGVSRCQATAHKVVEAMLDSLALAGKPVIVKVEHGILYVRAQVGDAIVLIQAKVADSATAKALGRCGSRVAEAVGTRVVAVQALIGDTVVTARAKCGPLVEQSDRVRASLEALIRQAAAEAGRRHAGARVALVQASEQIAVNARGRFVYVSGMVGDTLLYVKTRRESSKALALETYANAVQRIEGYAAPVVANVTQACAGAKVKAIGLIEPVHVKVKGNVVYIMGKIGDTEVYLTSKAAGIVGKASDALGVYCVPVYIKVQGGYLYFAGRLGDAILFVQTEVSKAQAAASSTFRDRVAPVAKMVGDRVTPVASKVLESYGTARTKALMITDGTKAKARTIAGDEKFQVTAAAATGSAVVLGAGAGAAGFVTGGTIGAAVGSPLALFTFGLSIPVGAAVGAASGLCIGTATGSTVGLVGGGAVGYSVQTHKKEISEGVSGAISKVNAVKVAAIGTASSSAATLRARIVGGTGGTA
mmetsp:Transcript_41393/g.122870  ORF Transcript_41393/g.122870 Transcript_41393/m.122870 type:complete len:487 (+) Transcript_41393:3-1463(+)